MKQLETLDDPSNVYIQNSVNPLINWEIRIPAKYEFDEGNLGYLPEIATQGLLISKRSGGRKKHAPPDVAAGSTFLTTGLQGNNPNV